MNKRLWTIGVLSISIVVGCRPRSDRERDGGTRGDTGALADAGLPVFETDFELAYFDEARGALDGTEPGTRTAQLTRDGRWQSTVERAADGTVTRTLSRDGAAVRTTVWSNDGLTVTADYDEDDDGRAEVHLDVTRGPTLADQRIVVTEAREAEGVVSARLTYARLDETMLRVTLEQPDASGELTVRRTFDTTVLQGDSVIRPLDPNGEESCANDVAAGVVRRAIEQGTQQGVACMESLDPSAHRCLMDLLSTHDVAVHCASGTDLFAQISIFDTLVGPIDGTIDVTIDERRFFDLPSDASRASAMFHEMLHLCRGVHDPADIGSGVRQAYTDGIQGCAVTCFGDDTQRDRCTCAACRGTDSCDPACSGFPSCHHDLEYCDSECTGEWRAPFYESFDDCNEHCDDTRCKGAGCATALAPCST